MKYILRLYYTRIEYIIDFINYKFYLLLMKKNDRMSKIKTTIVGLPSEADIKWVFKQVEAAQQQMKTKQNGIKTIMNISCETGDKKDDIMA